MQNYPKYRLKETQKIQKINLKTLNFDNTIKIPKQKHKFSKSSTIKNLKKDTNFEI